jgi:phage terminase large subunit
MALAQRNEQPLDIPAKLVRLIAPKRFKVIIGGRGGGKSESVAAIVAAMVDKGACNAVCCREFQNSIKQSVHSLVSRKIRELDIYGFDIQATDIYHKNGGRITYQGLARDPQAIKSIDDAEICWVEEAQSLSEVSLEELTPSIRGQDGEIWFTANLQASNDPFSQRFFKPFEKELRKKGWYEDDLHTIVWINYYDNPWFAEASGGNLEMERQGDKERLSEAAYAHKWLGEPADTVENAIILPEWFDAAVDAHKIKRLERVFRPYGAIIASHDPSDTGEDAKGFCLRHGSIIRMVREKLTGEVDEGCDWATGLAIQNDADWFTWDGDGMGAGLKRQVATAFEGKPIKYHMFRGSLSGKGQDNAKEIYQPQYGDSDTNPKTYADTFYNNRAQYYTNLATRFFNTYRCVVKKEYMDPDSMISIDSEGCENIPLLRSEVCRIPSKPNSRGLIQIMNKQEMKQLEIDSPNQSDAIMMSLFSPPTKVVFDPISYPPTGIV